MPSKYAYNLGAVKGIGSSTRMYQFCRETSQQPWTCIDQFITINPIPLPVPVPGIMKTAFLLELTGVGATENDITIQNTANYYWNAYPQEFIRCPIVDTQSSLELTLSLLDEYYGYGFRNFVGFTRSTMVNNVLNWFNLHQDATGISALSTDPTLSIPKNIYRMTCIDNFIIDSIRQYLTGKTVHYIYSKYEDAPNNIIPYIEDISGIILDLIPIDDKSGYFDFSDLSFINQYPTTDIMLLYIIDTNIENYINSFSTNGPLTFSGSQYDIRGIAEPIINSNFLTNKYNISSFKGIETSIMWRNGYADLTANNFSIATINILNLLNAFLKNESVNNINSHFGILEFDPVTKDLLYPAFLIEIFVGNNKFVSKSLYMYDPILGQYNATFTNPPLAIENIPTPSYKPYGKAIALLELTNYSNNIDTIYNESLYYYWYKNPDFPKFPIIDTGSSIVNTISLLNKYYDEGYRIFLGFSRSSLLTEVVYWFNERPDAVGISLWSTAASLNNVPRNIYRTNPSDDTIVNAVLPYLPNKDVGNVYYIYTETELAAEDVLKILQSDTSLNVIPYAVDSSNLNVHDLQLYFSDATSNDVTLLYIFDEQSYFDLFNASPPLTFPGNQYDIANSQLPDISGEAQTELNNKLYYIQNTYPNTGLLWRENAAYLSGQAGGNITTSTGLANALNMIDYFQKGKNVGLLASYSAVLQFNQYKDIMYPSFLFRLYQKDSNSFVESSISFDDPLLGSFEATFAT